VTPPAAAPSPSKPATGSRAWDAARRLAAVVRESVSNPSFTGRRWRRPPKDCPEWCAGDHQCTARLGYPSGQHRSDPVTWSTPYGALVATRVLRTASGRQQLEVRTVVDLHPDEQVARGEAQHLIAGIDLVIRATVADRLVPPAQRGAGSRRLTDSGTEALKPAGHAGAEPR
jgi:hypothetical protein